MLRRCALVVLSALALTTAPTLASTSTGVVHPLVSTVGLAADTVVGLGKERLVGVTWSSGSPTVRYRWHSLTGWSSWLVAEDESDEGRPGTAPLWRPRGADSVQLRTTGAVRDLRLTTVVDGPARRSLGLPAASAATGRAVLGRVWSRAEWGADESWRRRGPSYASRVDAVVVHHTVNANGYKPDDVPRLIQADYAYHVQTRGWPDLGYNLLVDQFGRVWEGRAGGLGRATIGTHAQGFNTGTLGVAMIGDMTQTTASHEAEKALARVVAYASSTWGWDPRGVVTLTSKGSPRFASGQRVTLPRVFGHQQTGVTACPGSLQQRLPYLRDLAVVALRPAPAVVDVTLTGAPVHAPTPAVLRARLTPPAAWRAQVTDATGAVVAAATGQGTSVRLSWDGEKDGLPVLPGTYGWTVRADDDFHDPATATGTFDVGLPFVDL